MHSGNADQKVVAELARSLLALVRDESCGECLPCWHGVRQITAVLDKVGNKSPLGTEELAAVGELARTVGQGAKCGVGRIGGRLVLELLSRYPSVFQAGA